jgi:DNA-binding response OmpR family regulator
MLPRKEYRLLCALRDARGIASNNELAYAVWREPNADSINALRELVYRLRRKGYVINTIKGIGYAYAS